VSYTLEFEIKGLPPMSNQLLRMKWPQMRRITKQWKRSVWAASWHKRPAEPLNNATLTLTRISTREPDTDGLTSGFKSVIDGLVEAKVIIDDKPSIIGSPVCLWEKGRHGESRIRVKVEGTTHTKETT
jgi:hypothetical protein